MYAFISGILEDIGPPVVVDVQGVGFELWVPERQRLALPAPGQKVRLWSHLAVREDDLTLYGFLDPRERGLFRALLGVNGVGPKVALAVLGSPDGDGVLRAIIRGEVAPLTRIKGVGKKTAERMVLELQDKVEVWLPALPLAAAAAAGAGSSQGSLGGPGEEAALALASMGLSPDKAREAVAKVPEDERAAAEDISHLVRLALRRAEL